MSKYGTELRREVAKAYLADKYSISNKTIVRKRVNAFKFQGYDGLKTKKRGRPSNITKDKKTIKFFNEIKDL